MLQNYFVLILGIFILSISATAFSDVQPNCSKLPGNRPFPEQEIGKSPFCPALNHIVVVMQENHSFDNYFGALAHDGYEGQIDGISSESWNLDKDGKKVFAYHETSVTTEDPEHSWKAMHEMWNGGKNDNFVKHNGKKAIGYYTREELPYYYKLANTFAVGDRHFCSTLGPTFPNRFFLYAGTAFGHTQNDKPVPFIGFAQKTIFDVLSEHGISWKYYGDGIGFLILFQPIYWKSQSHIGSIADYDRDAQNGTLPSVSFVESDFQKGEDEHPPSNVQVGQQWVSERVKSLMEGMSWPNSALFLLYDENGGYFDHVAPPLACLPDGINPQGESSNPGVGYDRLGLRVPFLAVSPFVKRHYVSHNVQDHSSVLRFIETRFNLPALTARDANATPLTDYFDCEHPRYEGIDSN